MPQTGPGRQLTVRRTSQKKKGGKKKDANVTVVEQVASATEAAEIKEMPDAPALIALKEKVPPINYKIIKRAFRLMNTIMVFESSLGRILRMSGSAGLLHSTTSIVNNLMNSLV